MRWSLPLKFALAIATWWVAMRQGTAYVHLCRAGSKAIELFAAMGLPLVAGAAVLGFRRYRVSLPIAIGLILSIHLLRDPYLKWVHGPSSPWPAISAKKSNLRP